MLLPKNVTRAGNRLGVREDPDEGSQASSAFREKLGIALMVSAGPETPCSAAAPRYPGAT